MPILRAYEKLTDLVWQSQRWPAAVARLVVAVARDLGEGYLTLRATSLVYTTLLSLAPVLAISFSVLKGIGAQNQIEPFLQQMLQPLGNQSAEIAARIIGFVDKIQVGVLGVVGFAFLIYSVVALMSKIEESFNDIWRVPGGRSFAMRVRDYTAVLLVGPLFIFLSLGMSASVQHSEFVREWLGFDILGTRIERIFEVTPYVLFTLAFAALYMFMPNTRVRAVPALVAGFTTGVLWKLLGWVFGLFVAGSANYAAIYSAFAGILLFMIWIYMGWLIVLIGASLSYYLQNPSNQRLSRGFRRISLHNRDRIALEIAARVGADFYDARQGVDVSQVAQSVGLPDVVVGDIADDMIAAGILAETRGIRHRLVPGRPFDTTSVADMLRDLHAGDSGGIFSAARVTISAAVDAVMAKEESARTAALGKVTLKQLASGDIA